MISGIDGTIVATALPSIVHDLGGVSGIAWVVERVPAVPGGDHAPLRQDRRRLRSQARAAVRDRAVRPRFRGLWVRAVDADAARGARGAGHRRGWSPVLGMAILGDLVPPRQLGRWLGYQGMLFAGAVVVGPLLGGFFVDHLSWRWAFFINVPFAILAVAILVPRSAPAVPAGGALDRLPRVRAPHRRAGRARRARDRRRQGRRLGVARVGWSPAPVRGVRRRVRVAPTPRGGAVRAVAPVPEPGVADRGAGQLHVRAPLLPRGVLPPGLLPGGGRGRRHRLGPPADPVHDRDRSRHDVRGTPGRADRSVPRLADPGWRRHDDRCARAHHRRSRHLGRRSSPGSAPSSGSASASPCRRRSSRCRTRST